MSHDPPKRRRTSGRVRLADVAHAAGVSPITASRVLRAPDTVHPDTRERVLQAVQRLGYVPDLAARTLASAQSNLVVVLVPMLSNALFVDLLEAAHAALFERGYSLMIGVTHYSPAEEETLLRTYLSHRPAGLLLTGLDQTPQTQALLQGSGCPWIHVMELAQRHDRHCVGFSQQAAAAAMTEHLIDQGHRRIAFAAAQLDPRTLQRLAGWRATLQAHGLHDPALERLDPAPSSVPLGARMLESLHSNTQRRPDAIFFCNDDLAQGALLAAQRLGLRVPEHLAIAGFNDLAGSADMVPPLTTVRTPRREIGHVAAQRLLALMEGQAVEPGDVDLGFEVVVRGSA